MLFEMSITKTLQTHLFDEIVSERTMAPDTPFPPVNYSHMSGLTADSLHCLS